MLTILRLLAVAVAMACLALPSVAKADEAPKLVAEKQTTLGLYLTALQAHEKWQQAPGAVKILDVRTPEEYLFIGHADMAWNVPLAAQTFEWDAAKKQFPMRPLPDFVDRVRSIAKPEDTLLVMCRSGGRSAMAVNLLAQAGFKNVYNITDGFEGDSVKDPDSVYQRPAPGERLAEFRVAVDIHDRTGPHCAAR